MFKLSLVGKLFLNAWMSMLLLAGGVVFLFGIYAVLTSLVSFLPVVSAGTLESSGIVFGIMLILMGAWLCSGPLFAIFSGTREAKLYCLFVSLVVVYSSILGALEFAMDRQGVSGDFSAWNVPFSVLLLIFMVGVYFAISKSLSK